MGRENLGLALAIFFGTTVADWVTKLWAEARLVRSPIELIDGFFYLRLAYNRGVAFSAFESLPHWVLGFGAILLLCGVLWSMRQLALTKAGATALALVASGGLNNAIDRLIDGRVTDMIAVWRWPVFNIADTGITIGVALMLLASRDPRVNPPAAPADPSGGEAAPGTPPPSLPGAGEPPSKG